MSGRQPSRRLCGGVLLAATLYGAPAPAAHAAEVTLDHTGHVYRSDERVRARVSGAPGGSQYRLVDFYDREIATGSVPDNDGNLSLAPPGPGYYVLKVAGIDAAATLAVLPDGSAVRRSKTFGVATHFAQGWQTDVIPLIGAAGIGTVRDEQYWARVETRRGEYRFPADFTGYMAALQAARIEPLLVLSFANPLYDDGNTPWSDPARAAFARYAVAVASRYADQVQALEVWNEYNGSFCKGPCRKDRPAHYAALLETTYKALKAHDANLTVVGGAAVKVPLPWFKGLVRHGAAANWDAVAAHPYRPHAEGVERDIAQLQDVLREAGSRAPVWATETGRQVHDEAGLREAARYLVRQATLLRSAGVERMYWYLLRDYANFKGMGLLRGPDDPLGRYAPTPAYVAYANVIAMLDGARFAAREDTDPRTHVYRFARDGQAIRVAWSRDPVVLTAQAGSPLVETDLMGQTRTQNAGRVELRLDENPRYFVGALSGLTEQRADKVLGDSESDFALAQGSAGWHYGMLDAEGRFTPLDVHENAWGQYWGNARNGVLRVDRSALHPARGKSGSIAAARRWISPASAPVRLRGSFHHRSGGDGVNVRVLRDGVELWGKDLPGARTTDVSFDLKTTVAAGTRIDFVVSPGSAGDVERDSTGLRVQVLAPR